MTVSVDVRGGRVASAGWTHQTEMEASAVIEHLQRRGVKRLVYSSIERDGMLTGPDVEEVKRVAEAVRGTFIYSGGIGTLEDLRALADAAPGQPHRRDRRQGALRAALRRRARRARR